MDSLVILLPAFVMTAFMAVTHSYFGLHVLSRGIIFIDLALAQVAAFGVSLAFLMGYSSESLMSKSLAIAATIIAALAFSYLHKLPNKTAREVTIGILYVVTTALTLIILSQTAQGMEELKSLLNGNILWVTWVDVAVVAIIYCVILLLHVIYRKQFYKLSFADNKQPKILWESVFFISFAIVITLAVNVAGILMVFAFLIIPAYSATLISTILVKQYALASIMAMTMSLLGLLLAYSADLPVGSTLVVTLGLLPLLAMVFMRLTNNRSR